MRMLKRLFDRLKSRLEPYIVLAPADPNYGYLVTIAVVAGIVFVFSTTFPLATKNLAEESWFAFLYKQAVRVGVGFLGLAIASVVRPRLTARAAPWLFAAGVLLLPWCRFAEAGRSEAGHHAWMALFGRTFQPSELVKVLYVILLAAIISRPRDNKGAVWRIWRDALIAMIVFCGALVIQGDLGMVILVVAVTLVVLFIRGLSVLKIAGVATAMGLAGYVALHTEPFSNRLIRIKAFFDMSNAPPDATLHMRQMLAALARGGLRGLGLGMSCDRWGAMPAATVHTDSIFCIIGGELGIVGAVGIIALVLLMAIRAFQIGSHAATPLGWYLCASLGSMLALQSLINIAVATVSMPCTGLTLPFISYGGTSLLSCMIAAGCILAVSRTIRAAQGHHHGDNDGNAGRANRLAPPGVS